MLRRSQKCHGLGGDPFLRSIPLLFETSRSYGRLARFQRAAREKLEKHGLVELALGVYVAHRPELSSARHTGDG
jgi:hypothetical protein